MQIGPSCQETFFCWSVDGIGKPFLSFTANISWNVCQVLGRKFVNTLCNMPIVRNHKPFVVKQHLLSNTVENVAVHNRLSVGKYPSSFTKYEVFVLWSLLLKMLYKSIHISSTHLRVTEVCGFCVKHLFEEWIEKNMSPKCSIRGGV